MILFYPDIHFGGNNEILSLYLKDQETESCTDDLPEYWRPNDIYQPGILCNGITCAGLARSNSCSIKFSEAPLSNCVDLKNGTVIDFCQFSCNNCGRKQRPEGKSKRISFFSKI